MEKDDSAGWIFGQNHRFSQNNLPVPKYGLCVTSQIGGYLWRAPDEDQLFSEPLLLPGIHLSLADHGFGGHHGHHRWFGIFPLWKQNSGGDPHSTEGDRSLPFSPSGVRRNLFPFP